jgi:DNA-binding response OmpR family regulator
MKKVLVVDDDTDILDLVQIALTMNGFSVKTESRWENMNRAIVDFTPQLILLDVSLGTADGRDLCKKLKEDASTKDIRIVLFSANIEMQNSIGQCQADSFIAKPFEIAGLVRTINNSIRD